MELNLVYPIVQRNGTVYRLVDNEQSNDLRSLCVVQLGSKVESPSPHTRETYLRQ